MNKVKLVNNADMKKIRKLAREKGLPLTAINIKDFGVAFQYSDGVKVETKYFPDFKTGVEKELKRLG